MHKLVWRHQLHPVRLRGRGWTDTHSESVLSDSDDFDLEELEGDALIKNLQIKCQHELDLEQLVTPMQYENLLHTNTLKEWKSAESR